MDTKDNFDIFISKNFVRFSGKENVSEWLDETERSEQEIDVSSSNIDTDIGAANILGVIPAEKVPMFSTEHSSIVIHKVLQNRLKVNVGSFKKNLKSSTSVHRLDLNVYNHQFNEEECFNLSRSPLTFQCEVLFIQVINRQSIINLVKNMINLRALHIQCEDDLVQWLKNHLPSTCLIVRNSDSISQIQMWIQ
ncbi:unnamed protein product [Rotaria sp. Silwood1]|nr:unnamed protein product [Rotaria sp. Silwood1]